MNDIDPGWPYNRNGKRPITDSETPPLKRRRRSRGRSFILFSLVAIFALVCLVSVGYFVKRNNDLRKENERLSQPEELAKNQQEELISTVGKIVELPQDETPTTATVNDLGKLKGQLFFEKAQIGDKVLIFTKAKTAYLYRPSTNKIVNIAPINLSDNLGQ